MIGASTTQMGRKGSGNNQRSYGGFDEWERERKLQTSNPTVLVVRVVASDSTTTRPVNQLSDDVFGTISANDPYNLKSQYNDCSYGQLDFQPAPTGATGTTTTGIVDGVYEVTLPSAVVVNGVSDGTIRNAVTTQLSVDFDTSASNVADYVMLCLPPGTSGGWIAYAYINHWLSVYNDQ